MVQNNPTILIVDDDADTRDLVGRFLSNAGYGVRFAANGWEGLLALETPVDLVLLDLMMPGMDGAAFLRTLRAHGAGKHVPVVVITAMAREEVEPVVRGHD